MASCNEPSVEDVQPWGDDFEAISDLSVDEDIGPFLPGGDNDQASTPQGIIGLPPAALDVPERPQRRKHRVTFLVNARGLRLALRHWQVDAEAALEGAVPTAMEGASAAAPSAAAAVATAAVPRTAAPPLVRGTVVMLHTLGLHSGYFDQAASFLAARGYEVWALDLQGHGLSQSYRSTRMYFESFDDLVDDAVLAALHASSSSSSSSCCSSAAAAAAAAAGGRSAGAAVAAGIGGDDVVGGDDVAGARQPKAEQAATMAAVPPSTSGRGTMAATGDSGGAPPATSAAAAAADSGGDGGDDALRQQLPLFLYGESIGATVVMLAALRPELRGRVAGLVLAGAALQVPSGLVPPSGPLRQAVEWLSTKLPMTPLPSAPHGPIAASGGGGDRDFALRVKMDPLAHPPGAWLRARPLACVIRGCQQAAEDTTAAALTCPLLVLHGLSDTRCPSPHSERLVQAAASADKTLRLYSLMPHMLLHDTSLHRRIVLLDIAEFLDARS